ncbi:MAG: peptide chain release factor 1 [Okeania sp. SIO2C9]|uniref:peptide chain release factor 1 n=1 Tax=Okeania sp. SIO2C9 TaxID=2607791 RepID=UPI0013BFDF7C|nr:peptide chain release factor 1 [Okeania sp. SIO2C9]NEQ75326.1 peptide chain release factor 1 [Okeania sp. SIO2C9]
MNNNIWQRLKSLPWRELFLVSFIAILAVVATEVLLILSFTYFVVILKPLSMLFSSPIFGVLIPVGAAVGMGALAVYLLEFWQKQWLLNNSSLWTLVLCLFIGLLFKSLFPLPPVLVSASRASLISLAIGVFWKGRPYWQR